jgi:hypothetical protein
MKRERKTQEETDLDKRLRVPRSPFPSGFYPGRLIAPLLLLLLLGALFTLSACTNAVRSPSFPESELGQEHVAPLSTYLSNEKAASGNPTSRTGIATVKILLVHGMSHSDLNWSSAFIDAFSKRRGFKVGACEPVSIPTYANQPHPAELCIQQGTDTEFQWVFYSLHWSPITDPYRCTRPLLEDREKGDPIKAQSGKDGSGFLCGRETVHYPVRRALVNGTYVKDVVMNNGLPDVVLYLSTGYGPVIRDAVAEALCRMYADDPKKPCAGGIPPPGSQDRVVFITHSLGANLLLDTLTEIVNGQPGTANARGAASTDDASLAKAIDKSFEQRIPFYMLANQYVLLNLQRATKTDRVALTDAKELPDFFDIRKHSFFESLRRRRTAQGLQSPPSAHSPALQVEITAFSDPNDDLSFLLPSATVAQDSAGPDSEIRVQNVFVKNAWEYLGLFENPGSAHLAYLDQPEDDDVLSVILCGMDRQGVGRC